MSGGYFNALCRESLFTPSPQLLDSCSSLSLLSSVVSFFFLFCFRWQNVSLSGRGRPGLSDVSACSFLPCVCVACVCVQSCALVHPVYHLGHFPHTSYLTPSLTLGLAFTSSLPSFVTPSIFFTWLFASAAPIPPLNLLLLLLCRRSPFHLPDSLLLHNPSSSWISVLQNSKEEALNQAFKGDQHVGENNIVQELTKAILGEVKRMTGNDVCCDCGAPSEWQRWLGKPLASAHNQNTFFWSLNDCRQKGSDQWCVFFFFLTTNQTNFTLLNTSFSTFQATLSDFVSLWFENQLEQTP